MVSSKTIRRKGWRFSFTGLTLCGVDGEPSSYSEEDIQMEDDPA